MSHRVWIRLDLPDHEMLSLRESIPECEYLQGTNVESDERQLADIDVVFTEAPLLENLTTRMPHLKWLHVTRGGVSAYLTPDVKARPIHVTGSKGIHGVVFSEFALACIFAFAKKLSDCLDAQKQKKWENLQPMKVEGTTIGIVGLGTAGSQLARKAKALGMRIVAVKRTVTDRPDYVDQLGEPDFLPTLLSTSDFVVLLLASVPSTFNILGERELRSMKPRAYLINLTGGRAVDERLLVRALKEGWIAGAALDAFASQPLPVESELWNLSNVIISPRLAGITSQKWPNLLPIFKDNLKRFIGGEALRNVVNKELGY
jgi:D-2-hydroxyacid dehydrogenase (NADP+)